MEPIRIKAFRNKYKKSDKHPAYKGKYKGKEVAVWVEQDNEGQKCLSINLKDAEEYRPTLEEAFADAGSRSDATGHHDADDLPF